MSGPPRTPTPILKLRGSTLAKGRAQLGEPHPQQGAPEVPDHLDTDAQVEWARVVEILTTCNVLTHADRATLAAYCVQWSRWRKAEAQVAEIGEIIKSPSGYPIVSPWLSIANRAEERIHKLSAELGLTPASRSRISIGTPHRDAITEYVAAAKARTA